ncbi:HlyD family secretion protein [Sphingomonas xinjiangensis]|uniref:Membrane fusion protein (Multidrug efflux system) n=1 Tax=Sphingomonas xinjiangensis TaxID=643568 RepID=A0A840YPN3_9SPHN|nr:HlyD family secretion protein [Sphingomonas xinjiangensis]MBB5709902.1 membrane fusion protein (multidrug efflux system) [Sphingomonas xinjiangensis]
MSEQDQRPSALADAPNDQSTQEDAAPAKKSPLKNPRVRIILLLIVAAILVFGGLWFARYQTRGKYLQSTNDAYVQADAVVVSSRISGYVERVLVVENQRVKAGQPLLQIDARDYRAQAEQAQAQIDVAAANAEGVRAQIREQGAAIDQARAQLAAAQSALTFARSEVARYTPLAATGAETRERLSQLRDQARQAEAQVATARAGLDAAQRRVGTLRTQIAQAQSQGRAAQAQLAAANVNATSSILRASRDGRVGDKTVQPGQLVQPGVRLMSIVPDQQLYVEANFKETQIGLMRVGQPVTVKVDALDGVEIHGRIESFSPGTGAQFSLLPPQNATGNFTKIVQRIPVRIAIDLGPTARKLILPGMSVDVEVDTIAAKGQREAIEREQKAHNAARRK